MAGKYVDFMKIVEDYYVEKHLQHCARDAYKMQVFDAEKLYFGDQKVTLEDWATKITKRHISDDSARGHKKKIDLEERVTIKIDIDRSFVFGELEITAAKLLFGKLPEKFRKAAKSMFHDMRDSFDFPIAGCEEYIYSRKVSVKAGVVKLHETQYEIPLTLKTTFRGHVVIDERQEIHMHDVIKSKWNKLRVSASSSSAREASVDQFCEKGTFVSLGTCTLTTRRIE